MPNPEGPGKPPMILDQALVDELVSKIEKGTFPYIAAESVGVSATTYQRWMIWGTVQYMCDEDPSLDFDEVIKKYWPAYSTYVQYKHLDLFATFYCRVTVAAAEARSRQEVRVAEMDPLAWLRKGPGKERPGRPGWGDLVAVTGQDGQSVEHRIEVVDYRKAVSPLRPPPEEPVT